MSPPPGDARRSDRSSLSPVDDRTDIVRGREALGVVKVIGPAMTGLLVVFAFFDAATHPDQMWWRVPTDVIPAGVLAFIVWLQRRGTVTAANAGWWTAVGSLVVSTSILVTVVYGAQVPIMIYLLVMTVVNGALALTTTQFVVTQTVPVLGPLVAMVSVGGLIAADSFADWIALWLVTLAASIAVHVARERGFREMARVLELLEQQAIEDPVTGLGTRRALEQTFPVVRSSAEVTGLEVFLVFVDVDGLKAVNDSLGHDEGDRVILTVARALREAARSRDVLVRWGGDEFAVLGVGDSDAAERMETSIAQRVAALNPLAGEWPGTVSTGASTMRAEGCELAALVAAADSDMYRRRRALRGRRATDADPLTASD